MDATGLKNSVYVGKKVENSPSQMLGFLLLQCSPSAIFDSFSRDWTVSIAAEIEQRYQQYQGKVEARAMGLKKTAASITQSFVEYVGITHNGWHDDEGKFLGKRVDLGIGQGRDFSPTSWTNLPVASDGSVRFAISYQLIGDQANWMLTLECTLRTVPAGYAIDVAYVTDNYQFSSAEAQSKAFAPLFDLMVEQIKSRIDPESVVVHKL